MKSASNFCIWMCKSKPVDESIKKCGVLMLSQPHKQGAMCLTLKVIYK